jgi:hypothetical protein
VPQPTAPPGAPKEINSELSFYVMKYENNFSVSVGSVSGGRFGLVTEDTVEDFDV